MQVRIGFGLWNEPEPVEDKSDKDDDDDDDDSSVNKKEANKATEE